MDRVSFTIWAVVGKNIALVAFFSLGDKRRARIPPIRLVALPNSSDARPNGAWLWIAIGAAFGSFGFLGLRYRKDDTISATDSKADDLQSETLDIN